MVTRFPLQPVIVWPDIVLRDKCSKCKLDMISNTKVMKEKACCHGNSASLATSNKVNQYYPEGQV